MTNSFENNLNVMVVDDEKNIRRSLKLILDGEGYSTITCSSAEESLRVIYESRIDVILMDVKLPGMDGIEALTKLREINPELPVIIISGHASISDAVQATKIGAYDFLEKPLDRDKVLLSVRNCGEASLLKRKMRQFEESGFVRRYEMLGTGQKMKMLYAVIEKVAPSAGRVLITGESGSGKELIARAIHINSKRANAPFIKVNCAAIPSELIESELFGHEKGAFSGATQMKRGRFEMAHHGTIFLDEIGDMSLNAQAKVLRVLQTGDVCRVGGERTLKVDVRVLAATHRNLKQEISKERFREDLFFRLNVVPIESPPLRERLEDVSILVSHFMEIFCKENGFKQKNLDPKVIATLKGYNWPGNVRELKNLIERLVIMSGDLIVEEDLPAYLTKSRTGFDISKYSNMNLKEMKEATEREFILSKLLEFGWNITHTADALGIERTNLHKKVKYYDLKRVE